MARIKCSVGKGGSWREFQKDTVFVLQKVEECLQEGSNKDEDGDRQKEGKGSEGMEHDCVPEASFRT